MVTKRIAAVATLLLLFLSTAGAQETATDVADGNAGSHAGQADSLQILSDELAQIKADLDTERRNKQMESVWKRKKYWKVGLGNPDIERTDGEQMSWDTEFSVFLQGGRTVYFHSKPIAGMVKIGLDYGLMDLSYAKLKLKTAGTSGPSFPSGSGTGASGDGFDDIVSADPSGSVADLLGIDLGMHKFEYGVHVGPSVSINPWNHLVVAAYFHLMPTASGILENDQFSYGFGCAMSAGVSVAYKAISVGVEGLWSTIKYKQASFDDDDEDEGDGDLNLFTTKDFKLKQKGPRFYLAIRF